MATGSIREKRDGHWEMRVYLGPDPITGKKCYKSKSTRSKGKRTRENELRAFIAECEAAPDMIRAGTFGELVARWLESIRADRSPTTIAGYETKLRVHILPALGTKPLTKVRSRDLDDLYAGCRKAGLAPASIRQVHAICHSALARAVKWDLIASNPAEGASPPSVPRPDHSLPNIGEVAAAIRDYAEVDPDTTTAWWVAASLGGRRGETLGLQWRDVDLDGGSVLIRQAVVWVQAPGASGDRGRAVVKGTKTHSSRRLALEPFTLEVLRQHRQRCDDRALAVGVAVGPDSFVFSPDASGKRHVENPNTVSSAWARWSRSRGLNVPFKNLRHLAATTMLSSGVDIKTVSTRLGHARTSTTLDIYAQAVPELDRKAAAVMGEALGGGKPSLPATKTSS